MPSHLTLAELNEGLPEILRSPQDNGTLARIVIRPEKGLRHEPDSCELSLALGTHGDRWIKGGGLTTADGSPHPDTQICIMNARCIALIARERGKGAGGRQSVHRPGPDARQHAPGLAAGDRHSGDRDHRHAA